VGDGVYKSIDGGRTWINTGLKDAQQIVRMTLIPKMRTGSLWQHWVIHMVLMKKEVCTEQLMGKDMGKSFI
jgi:hypothetical protein